MTQLLLPLRNPRYKIIQFLCVLLDLFIFVGISDLGLFILQAWVVSGSPQSTLCAVGSGCGCRQGSSNGSPNGPSHVSSSAATWDLLYAAAGEVARMRKNDELYGLNHGRGGGVFGPPRKPSPVTVPVKNNSNPDVGFFPRQSLSHHQLQATQVLHVSHIHIYCAFLHSFFGFNPKPSFVIFVDC